MRQIRARWSLGLESGLAECPEFEDPQHHSDWLLPLFTPTFHVTKSDALPFLSRLFFKKASFMILSSQDPLDPHNRYDGCSRAFKMPPKGAITAITV